MNGGIVRTAKVMSVSYRKVQCLPHCASNSKKKAASSHNDSNNNKTGVFQMV